MARLEPRPPPTPAAAHASRPSLARRLRPGFLVTTSVIGLVALVGLALVLSRVIGGQFRDDQLDRTRSYAQLLAVSVIAPTLLGDPGRAGSRYRRIDQALAAARPNADFATILVFSPTGRVIYANDHRLIGRKAPASRWRSEALHGASTLHVQTKPEGATDLSRGRQIAVTVPIDRPGHKRIAAVAEIRTAYAPVAQQASSRTRNLKLVLFGVGLLIYAALWPRLLAASRALRKATDPYQQAVVRELRKGLERNELVVHFQPKVSLRDGQLTGMEALVRWNHPKRGMLSPDQFVPAAMAGELTGPLTIHVADLALGACRAWHAHGVEAGVDINLGAANVLDERLPRELGLLLDRWQLPPRVLGVEITESAIAADPVRSATVLEELHTMGIRVAIDDFGTGFSSLAGLRTLPVDELKIDRSFVSGLTTEPGDAAIVRSIIGLAHELDVKVIAEGVEDDETMRHLASLGCDQAQGYFFARPMELSALLAWMERPHLGVAAPVPVA
jgi:EAL domain-containing protein (putative c-di-GMP-specific phosphodiesterase class I)